MYNERVQKKATPTCRPETEAKYRPALELYAGSGLSCVEICRRCGVSLDGFVRYVCTYHRQLMLRRKGIECSREEAENIKICQRGQRPETHAKYKDAVEACDSVGYIEFNVSQIARLFGLHPTALSNQLRNHYPEILERREKERHRLGVNDNLHRGVKPCCKEQYAEAVEHLRTTDDTIRQTADLYNLSYSGLREHLLYYNKRLIRQRADRRRRAMTEKVRGGLSGNGGVHAPSPSSVEKYREAVRLYRDTAMTLEEICGETRTSVVGLRYHLRTWNGELVREHYDVDGRDGSEGLSVTKRYRKSTAAKYAEAISLLKSSGRPVAELAKELGLNPDTFRTYLREHEPELAACSGMTRLDNGRQALARSAGKYDEAIRLYETTAEPLKSIADRLGLQYKSLGGFVRRSRPDAIEAHKRLVTREERLRRQNEEAESDGFVMQKKKEEKQRILKALEQTGGHKRNAAKLLGICKSTFYNKLIAYGIGK